MGLHPESAAENQPKRSSFNVRLTIQENESSIHSSLSGFATGLAYITLPCPFMK